jgi:predicted nuclease of predicted toxin-antitoxin system
MSWPLYMDHHVPSVVTSSLRSRGIDVLTAEEDQAERFVDDLLLDRATELGRILITQDRGFLSMASMRRQMGKTFIGIIYSPQHRLTPSELTEWLVLAAELLREDEIRERVVFLPLS